MDLESFALRCIKLPGFPDCVKAEHIDPSVLHSPYPDVTHYSFEIKGAMWIKGMKGYLHLFSIRLPIELPTLKHEYLASLWYKNSTNRIHVCELRSDFRNEVTSLFPNVKYLHIEPGWSVSLRQDNGNEVYSFYVPSDTHDLSVCV